MSCSVSDRLLIPRETIPCDVCGSEHSRLRLMVDLDSVTLATVWIDGVPRRLGGREMLVECVECGLVYVNPRLAARPGLMPYSPEQESAYFTATRALRARAYAEVWRQVPSWLGEPPRSLLDVGCGDGVLLEAARQSGARILGTEISAGLIAEARRRLGAEVVWTPDAAPLGEGRFDVVTLFNVVEHLHSPRQMLKAVASWVRPGGVVLIHVPNFGGWPARWSGARWCQIEPFAHFYYFTSKTLSRLLRAVGLTPFGRFNLATASGWRSHLQRGAALLGLYVDNGLGMVARRDQEPLGV